MDRARAFKILFRSAAGFVVCATALPIIRTRAWWVRAWDFPRLQVAALGAAAGAAAALGYKRLSHRERILAGLTWAAVAAQLGQTIRYTPLIRPQVSCRARDGSPSVSLLTANVRMRNKNVGALLEVIRRRNPDLVFLLEPNERWMRQMEPIERDYPYMLKHPLENTYGMLLYSKLKLKNPEVRFLVQPDIPSFRALVETRGTEFWFYGLHPRPPVRGNTDGEIELPGSTPRDAELAVVGNEIGKLSEPVLVAGDFNDVAWSHTTRRFQRLARLLDPRVGRGLYTTFHAEFPVFRFPLDHLFLSHQFAIVEFCRERWVGSDHFPLFANVIIDTRRADSDVPSEPDAADYQEAREDVIAASSSL